MLYIDGVISMKDFGTSRQQNNLQFRLLSTDLDMAITANLLSITRIKNDIENLLLEDQIEEEKLKTALRQSLQQLQAILDEWKHTFTLISPIAGEVGFGVFWSVSQNVKAGEVVISVIPHDTLILKARLQFPIENSGKIRKGQRVNIKIDNYPHYEFGMLIGSINNVSRVPNNLLYNAEVSLEKGVETTYGTKLPVTQQLVGKAEILTDDLSLLVRIANPLRAIFDENIKRKRHGKQN